MKNDRFLPYAVILGVVAIVAIVTLFMGSGVEGAAHGWVESIDSDYQGCIDSDEANDRNVAGYLDIRGNRYHDYCLDHKTLHQYACLVGSKLEILTYECPKGCLNGKCIE